MGRNREGKVKEKGRKIGAKRGQREEREKMEEKMGGRGKNGKRMCRSRFMVYTVLAGVLVFIKNAYIFNRKISPNFVGPNMSYHEK